MLQEQLPGSNTSSLEQLTMLLSSLPSSTESSPRNTRQTYPSESSPKRSNLFSKGKKKNFFSKNDFILTFLIICVIFISNFHCHYSSKVLSQPKPSISVTKSHLTRSFSASNTVGAEPDDFLTGPPTVLMLALPRDDERPTGLLTEQEVLDMKLSLGPPTGSVDAPLTQEKRTRFASHDDGSIGNTSDNLEAISEAASNHSVASSLELENEDQGDNDNLSDMVSANVSGRGTPNISGRDTPSSQVSRFVKMI